MANDINGNQWYQPTAGLGSTGAYQSSGIPFVTGSLSISATVVKEISFPQVTKFIVVKNDHDNSLRVAFSQNGITGTNYFILAKGESFSADFRVTKLFLRGDSDVSAATIVAGLTTITADNLKNSWSGSLGVG